MADKQHLELLKEGINCWNRWREKNPDLQPDLSNANLTKAHLVEANFSKADITGANFAEANLSGANFSNLIPNLNSASYRSIVILSCFLILIGILSGLLAGAAGFSVMKYFAVDLRLEGYIVFFALVASYVTFLLQGLTRGSLSIVILLWLISVFRCGIIASEVFIYAFTCLFLIVFDGAISSRSAKQTFFARILTWNFGIALLYTQVINITYVSLSISKEYLFLGIPIAMVILSLNFYIAYKVLNDEDLSPHLKAIGLSFSSFGAIDFRQANLTNANFSGSNLLHANLGNTILTGACFYDVECLERAKLNGTILTEPSIQKLLVSRGQGEGKNYRGKNLKGAYLVEANLSGADLSEVDLSGANLCMANLSSANLSRANLSNTNFKGANLSGTVLVATQALGTNFSEATFTGACLEDWSINSTTRINDVICDYIYLRQNQQERRPSDINKNFAMGEFTKLFQKAQETVDLIFRDGIDWKAFLSSFQKLLVECGDEELSIQAIENKNDGAFIIRVNVPLDANKAEIEKYLKREYELILKAKDDKILDLSGQIVSERLNNTNLLDIITKMAEKENSPRIISLNSGNYNESITGNYIQGDYINMSQDLSVAAVQIQELLTQLQNQGITMKVAQEQVAKDMANKANSNPSIKGKLIKWGQSLGNTAANTTITEAAKEVFKIALRLSGIPIP